MNARDVLEHASKRSPALQVDTRSKQSSVGANLEPEKADLRARSRVCTTGRAADPTDC